MSTPSFPTDLATVLTSGYNVRETGLIGWWPMNAVPEYPDGAATYFQDAWATTDGWGGNSKSTLTVSGGVLTSTVNAAQTQAFVLADKSFGTNPTIRAKIKCSVSGTLRLEGTVGGIASTVIKVIAIAANTWITFDAYIAGVVTRLYWYQTGLAPGDTIQVDWIYVGDGTYATPSYDRSGLGYNASLYGATPTTGKSGNGLILDGTNDYLLLALPAATYPTLSLSAWVKLSAATSYCLFDPRSDAGVGGSQLMTDAVAYYVDGGSSLARIPYDGNWHHIVAPMTNIVVNKCWIGRTYSAASYLAGSIDELRFYTTLSADRRYGLYASPTTYAALPAYPLADGYDDSPQDNILRSSMSTGPVKSRLRSTVAPRIIQCQYHLDLYQKQILEQFYASLGGVNPFYWTTPDTGETLTVTFDSRPVYAIESLGWRARLALRVVA